MKTINMESRSLAEQIKYFTLLILFAFACTPAYAGDVSGIGKKTSPEHELSSLSYPSDPATDISINGKRYNSIGFRCYERGSYEQAIKYYLKAIDVSPEYPVTYNNLGVVYLKRNELNPAERCFRKAIELQPEYVKAICNLAVVYHKQKRNTEALDLYYRANSIDPSYVQNRVSLFREKQKTTSD